MEECKKCWAKKEKMRYDYMKNSEETFNKIWEILNE